MKNWMSTTQLFSAKENLVSTHAWVNSKIIVITFASTLFRVEKSAKPLKN